MKESYSNKECLEAFEGSDRDVNGYISAAELSKAVKSVARAHDVDCDGLINLKEFASRR